MASVDDLLRAIGDEVVPGRALADRLRVTRRVLHSLVSQAGPRVCRMGRTRAAHYARPRTLAGVGSSVPVTRISEAGQPEPAGVMTLLAGGGHWVEWSSGQKGERFVGLPPFAVDMSPQGFLGRSFFARHPELGLPARLVEWRDDHRLLALVRRGEDCPGDLILGHESFDRWLASPPVPVSVDEYPTRAAQAGLGDAGSSAAGEQPKFAVFSEGRHVIVKYAAPPDTAADRRWHDLLVCEFLALAHLDDYSASAASARWFDRGRFRFLEVNRFDRVGSRGRRGVLSLWAIDNEYHGSATTGWTALAGLMLAAGRVDDADARTIRWLDVFGQLIGNSDRHLGNLSFFSEGPRLVLAPVYDMLPMSLAPVNTVVVERVFEPAPPNSATFDVWKDAAAAAQSYWGKIAECSEVSDEMRGIAKRHRAAVAQAIARFAPT